MHWLTNDSFPLEKSQVDRNSIHFAASLWISLDIFGHLWTQIRSIPVGHLFIVGGIAVFPELVVISSPFPGPWGRVVARMDQIDRGPFDCVDPRDQIDPRIS